MALSILSALTRANAAFGALKDTLIKGRDAMIAQRNHYPDLAGALDPQIASLDAQIAALDAPLSEAALAELAVAVLPEVVNIVKGKLDPKKHAGDAI